MRGNDQQQEEVFSYIGLEQRVPKDHPLRAIRQMTDAALRELDAEFQRPVHQHANLPCRMIRRYPLRQG